MPTRLYVMPISNAAAGGRGDDAPTSASRTALVRLMPGLHPLLRALRRLRGLHGARRSSSTGARSRASRQIARFLDEARPEPPLFPRRPGAQRARVEEAERWGEQVLQPVPRRLFRHLLLTSERTRGWMGTEVMHLPAPRVLVVLFMPVIRQLAQISRADDAARAARTSPELPELLDHVDGLIADGTIGAAEPNAADFQILASVGVLRAFADLGARRCAAGRARRRRAACIPTGRRSRAACRGLERSSATGRPASWPSGE